MHIFISFSSHFHYCEVLRAYLPPRSSLLTPRAILHSLRKCQPRPCPYSKQYDEYCLDRVDDEHEIERVALGHAIEDQHRLDGKMPRAGAVGRGDEHGDAADDEGHQRAGHSKTGGEAETEEREVVVEEIADPDACGRRKEQWYVAHVAQRQDALKDAAQRHLHLIIYRQLLQKDVEKQGGGNGADGRHGIAGGREAAHDSLHARARAVEEDVEDSELEKQRHSRHGRHDERVDGALGHNRA